VCRDDSTRRPREPDETDEVRFGSRRPAASWRSGWLLIACGAALAAVAAGVVIGHGNRLPRARPASPAGQVSSRQLSLRGNWELFGYGSGWVVRIQFASGRITRTAVPPVLSSGPVTFLVGPHQAIIRPLDSVPGYLVPDGHPARLLPGALGSGGTVIPGPQPGTAWVQAGFQVTSMPLVRMDGAKTGVSLRLPPGGPWLAIPDGRGYVLVSANSPGGLYDVRPGGFHRIAGILAAVGPTQWLTVDCPAGPHCVNVVVNQAGGAPRILPGPSAEPEPGAPPGVIAPDGATAALIRVSGNQVTLHLLNLLSGADQQIFVSLDQGSAADQTLAWSPDSRWLFIVAANGELAAVNARTRHAEGLGVELPPIGQIAVRN
jgi:hypothetical protein